VMIGNNAREIVRKFTKEGFLSKWKALLKRIII